ncbi:VOC family protein [Demequina mangrovi]|uniref:Glyoxalase/Bleomycin resistance protein/Dioxygenase superfamily protein n=1 Tax=Demequina mangrovi TaxID=1043493 RepID=A0A1H6ZB44_9MICO|nr:VOC family protein [Demequina mangrovi]SEJ50558.1 Glyoxalase/Bleomycin resistance protein/Dioxygenase superfamily protein [Demequina mangrovi]
MLRDSMAFGSFSTDSVAKARDFYGGTLGLEIRAYDDEGMGPMLRLLHPGGGTTLIYEKEDHAPASHTVLNFAVDDFESAVAELRGKGITFERLQWTDEDGIARDPEGRMPSVAWFKDPADNWIALLESDGDVT